jgi:dihydroorotase
MALLLRPDGAWQPVDDAALRDTVGQSLDAPADGFVVPGLADAHAHLHYLGTEIGVGPEVFLAKGVTAAVDGGSAGAATVGAFVATVCQPATIDVRFFLNISLLGLVTIRTTEFPTAEVIDDGAAVAAYQRFAEHCLGFKVRISRSVAGEHALAALDAALGAAARTSSRVMVHITDPALPFDPVLDRLRAGDVVTHTFHGRGENLLDASGKVRAAAWRARERGVLFDVGHGMNHFAVPVARAALAEGFYPDIISTDWTPFTTDRPPVYDLLTVASRLVALGMPERAALEAISLRPRQLLGLGLRPPSPGGDLAVLAWDDTPSQIPDSEGGMQDLPRRLRLRAALHRGQRVAGTAPTG